MDLELTDKRAVITSASWGIGWAIAKALVAERCPSSDEQVTVELGGVDILVNSAAEANTGPMSDDQLDVKLKGRAALCARLRAAMRIAAGGGVRGLIYY